jgi:hypothetical protein
MNTLTKESVFEIRELAIDELESVGAGLSTVEYIIIL